MQGIKQEVLAYEPGDDWNQQKNPCWNKRKRSAEGILNFDKKQAINMISNTFHDFEDHALTSAMNDQCSFNPFDRIVELYDEKTALSERMLKDKEEMIARQEKLTGSKE